MYVSRPEILLDDPTLTDLCGSDISTSYVDRLQSYASLPSSPNSSRPETPTHPHTHPHIESESHYTEADTTHALHQEQPTSKPKPAPLTLSEHTPLISTPVAQPQISCSQTVPHPHPHPHSHTHAISQFFDGHHRHESRGRHGEHHERSPRIAAAPVVYTPEASPASHTHGRKNGACRHHGGNGHGHGHTHGYGFVDEADEDEESESSQERCEDGHSERAKVGKKRQVVGILVSPSPLVLLTAT